MSNSEAQPSRNRWVTSLLQIFIIFHLFVIVIAPNPSVHLKETFASLFYPYVNFFGINFQWAGFTSGAGPATYFEYDVLFKNNEKKSYMLPPLQSPFLFRTRYMRRITLVRLLQGFPQLTTTLIVPSLCKQHEGAEMIQFGFTQIEQTSIEEAKQGISLRDFNRRTYQPMGALNCNEEMNP